MSVNQWMSGASRRFSQEEVKGVAVKRQISPYRGWAESATQCREGRRRANSSRRHRNLDQPSIKESSGERYEHILTDINVVRRVKQRYMLHAMDSSCAMLSVKSHGSIDQQTESLRLWRRKCPRHAEIGLRRRHVERFHRLLEHRDQLHFMFRLAR